jgi:two-component system nitrogen regulation sensor histidine kinase GlnL
MASVALPAAFAPADLLDAQATALVVLDARDTLVYLNAAAQSLLAVGTGARGRSLAELVRDPAPLEELTRRARRASEPVARREVRLTPTARSDAQLTADCKGTALHDDFVLLELSDTTHQQRLSRDAALLSQLGGSRLMVKSLAHEIKNPLGGLRGAAQLLERELADPRLHEYTRVIMTEADRLCALVDNLLGPGQPPRKQSTNVHELLQHVYHLLEAEAPAGLTIVRDYDPSLPPLELDGDQIIQAMLNVGRNAVQVLDGAGRLILRTRALTNVTIGPRRYRVVASVQFEDNGPGVPTELADTIFYPLVTSRPGGTGLGLAVAQDIATRHDGLIEFESQPGRTLFALLLPFGGPVLD